MPPAGPKGSKYWRRLQGTGTWPKTPSWRYGWARSGACSSPRGPNEAIVNPEWRKHVCPRVGLPGLACDPFEDVRREYDASATVLKSCPRLRSNRHAGELADNSVSGRRYLLGPLLVRRKATGMGCNCRNVTACVVRGSLSRKSGVYVMTGASRS